MLRKLLVLILFASTMAAAEPPNSDLLKPTFIRANLFGADSNVTQRILGALELSPRTADP